MTPSKILESMSLPPLRSREEMLDILQHEQYGYLPPAPLAQEFTVLQEDSKYCCAGKAVGRQVEARLTLPGGEYRFPFWCVLPKSLEPVPVFIHIHSSDQYTSPSQPMEEIIDGGFGVLSFAVKDVTSDDDDFTNGLAGILFPDGKRGPTDPGKLALWAWAAQRVLDYALTLEEVDGENAAVIGLSRLGKTALLAGATDSRFRYVLPNNSGCAGAALFRQKPDETAAGIAKNFPYWFCHEFQKYGGREEEMPFDQHWMYAACRGRYICAGSCEEEEWATPNWEYLCMMAASPYWEEDGMPGFDGPDRFPEVGEVYTQGSLGFFLRPGAHWLSRYDWQQYMLFIRRNFA